MAESMPFSAAGSSFSSFFKCTVNAMPANLLEKIGLMRCDIYIFLLTTCSRASETEATSTCRKASTSEASSLSLAGLLPAVCAVTVWSPHISVNVPTKRSVTTLNLELSSSALNRRNNVTTVYSSSHCSKILRSVLERSFRQVRHETRCAGLELVERCCGRNVQRFHVGISPCEICRLFGQQDCSQMMPVRIPHPNSTGTRHIEIAGKI